MTYWTITYQGSEKSFADWGIENPSRRRRNMAVSEMTLVATGQPIDSADMFTVLNPSNTADQCTVVIKRDRVLTAGAYSSGSVFFTGLVVASKRIGSAMSEDVEYSLANVWTYLEKSYYTQTYPNNYVTDHVVLNLKPDYTGTWISIKLQIQSILDCCLALFPGAFTYDLSNLPSIIPPLDEKRSLTCEEAIKNQLQWVPDALAWVDETQTPPKIYIGSRYGDHAFDNPPTVVLPEITLAIGTGTAGETIDVVSETIEALHKIQVPQVILTYEQKTSVGQEQFINLIVDQYPAVASNNFNILRQTINLLGEQGSNQQATVESQLLPTNSTDWLNWLVANNQYLNSVNNLVLIDGAVTFTDDSGNTIDPSTLPAYEMLNHGTFHSWMRVGNTANGAVGIKQRVKVTAYVSYTDNFGNVIDLVEGEEVTVSTEVTNLASGSYNRVKISQYADPVPGLIGFDTDRNPIWNYTVATAATFGLSLAYWYYTIFNVLQYEGQIQIQTNTSDGEVYRSELMGRLINLSNGLSDWTTMNAMVQTVTENIQTGIVTVSFGQNKLLSAGKLIDLARQNRTRVFTFYGATVAGGNQVQDNNVLSPDAVARKSSERGVNQKNKDATIYTNADGSTTTITRDAINGLISVYSTDSTQPGVSLALSDIAANDGLNP